MYGDLRDSDISARNPLVESYLKQAFHECVGPFCMQEASQGIGGGSKHTTWYGVCLERSVHEIQEKQLLR